MGVVDNIISNPDQWLQNFILSTDHSPWWSDDPCWTTDNRQQTIDISLPHLTQRHVVPAEVADDVAGLAGEGLGAVAGEP